ncbi:peptide-methionine (S)-S-oxide reductase [Winogradskyella immobilis]|uniref:peptide-methionine (S)-S-oxide reductase n=1 Tax=Winogradskyella immobilis TaxID=2816852 RepID=A0ABS8EIS3_9FLAO|nr:peptide-methionine (S)-S-oxide reductase [Winogradskyella immobilis]MCC1483108.1 peptide-methionine (S)-S-oxide reductase [Winogradskyella immobilis]MCG0015203.1 peptide-methionine (S)-S-oxide reductase [Winogradskyella immobilis]
MKNRIDKIALGGGCHWCTEAIFQSLKGVEFVEQGYVASIDKNNTFSEAVIVYFNAQMITLQMLIEIHLHTHKSTSNHSMRAKYRSAVYTFSLEQEQESKLVINDFQNKFENKLITQVIPFSEFKASREAIQNYYQKNPNKPFCETFINPKLRFLIDKYSIALNKEKVAHLNDQHINI